MFIAFLWGIAFVFQRNAMDYMGPITFNAYRFLIAALCLLPIFVKNKLFHVVNLSQLPIKGGLLAGTVLFFGALFQQLSIQYTTLASVGFITGLYVVIVPLLGIFFGHRYKKYSWLGGVIACYGLYLLSGLRGTFENIGDLLALIGSLFWASHILIVFFLVKQFSPYTIAFVQFLVCSILSFSAAFLYEDNIFAVEAGGMMWVVITGTLVTAFAYTLQIIAQKSAKPFHAAIIFSLEAVFAGIAGYLVFQEYLSISALLGCLLMFVGCIVAQYQGVSKA